MGFLNVKGELLTYSNYKDKIEEYKLHGIKQFISLYRAQSKSFIPMESLKWGEEMEYQVYMMTEWQDGKIRYQLANRGPEMIEMFNKSDIAEMSGVVLMPEFGGWMIEAVPNKPYSS